LIGDLGHNVGVPFRQIADEIQARIESGEWPADFKLPSTVGLQTQYRVSHMTINAAVNLLVERGYIRAVKGVGRYVSEDWRARRAV